MGDEVTHIPFDANIISLVYERNAKADCRLILGDQIVHPLVRRVKQSHRAFQGVSANPDAACSIWSMSAKEFLVLEEGSLVIFLIRRADFCI